MSKRGIKMNRMNRRQFLQGLGLGTAAVTLPGCIGPTVTGARRAKIGVQLYSIRPYVDGVKDKDGKLVKPGVGLAATLQALAAMGYDGVEFAGYHGLDAKTIRSMLADAGLKACGSHVGGWRDIAGDKLKAACEFNLAFGNNILICPGGTEPDNMNWSDPKWDAKCTEHMKFICDFFNKAADEAAKMGCKVGIHNHMWEFQLKDPDGVTFWDRFFSGTDEKVLMQQDVGWTTCAGYDPCAEFAKYPHRSPTLHAKENGMGKEVRSFDGILGRPGLPGAVPVDWDRLIPGALSNGTEWFVVECERHREDLSAVLPSIDFLKMKLI